ncbi:MAG: S-methyl-5'-thioadenosine phosphorylase [Chloroflexi bacterium]|nr:S-methyl-5'-thioadenosine phosphorylase [Chloroflexota bacterium]MYH64670.1 S-methyl-5'-thioadenosine phosphorylase [Chloroflexota bacterium]
MEAVKIGVIGGSGLYNLPEISDVREVDMDTPFGKPSGTIRIGSLSGKRVAFVPRHGEGHTLAPHALPYRANIYALKQLGARFIIGVNAVGSLQENYAPGHLVTPDQLIDYTIHTRARSFFDRGLVAHVSVADPFGEYLRSLLADAAESAGATVHRGGCFLIEDGPRFATRAESRLFQRWSCHIIGMTAAPEAFLAREAEIEYAALAHVTDYDCWRSESEDTTSDIVIQQLAANIGYVQAALVQAVAQLDEALELPAHRALDAALATGREQMDESAIERLRPIVARVLGLGKLE